MNDTGSLSEREDSVLLFGDEADCHVNDTGSLSEREDSVLVFGDEADCHVNDTGSLSERRAAACNAVSSLRRSDSQTSDRFELPDSLVIVIPGDTVGATVAYLAQHHPQGGHLALHTADEATHAESVRIISLSPRKPEASEQSGLEPISIDPNANLEMLLTLLQTCASQPVSLVLMEFDWEPIFSVDDRPVPAEA